MRSEIKQVTLRQDSVPAGVLSLWRLRALKFLVCGTLAGAASWPTSGLADGPPAGKPAPPLTLHTLDGRSIGTDDLRGKVVILTFWATWCAPCKDELPVLSAYAAQHEGQGLEVLGFSLDQPDNLTAVRKIAAGLSFPVGLLGDAYAGGYGRIWSLPVNFTIDRQGTLVDNSWKDERPDWTEASLERIVTPLLENQRTDEHADLRLRTGSGGVHASAQQPSVP